MTEIKLLDEQDTLISVARASAILGLSPSALYGFKAGTEDLTRVPQGRRTMFILGEVLEHRQKLIQGARERKSRLTLVESRG